MWAEILECGLHGVFFNVLDNMVDTVEPTLDDFAKLLKTKIIFEEDDNSKGISNDNESNLDS